MNAPVSSPARAQPAIPSVAATIAALKPGQRYVQPRPPGSGDACLLAALARETRHTLAAFCADPLAAQRLASEITLFDPELRVRFLPDWETLPYDSFSPHQDLISERLRTLHSLTQNAVDVLIVPVTTALVRLAPTEFLAAYTFAFRQGDTLDEERLRAQLTLANYSHVTQVSAPGEFCIRGGLIDLFPMGSALPYRIDLFDRDIESIRSFDIDTQRSLYPVREIELLPGREFPMDEAARNRFRARFREVFEGDPSRALPYKDIGNGIAFAGIEYYLPLFFEHTASLFDYLPAETISLTLGDVSAAIGHFHQDAHNRWQFLKSDPERPVLAPGTLFLSDEEFHTRLGQTARLALINDQPHPDFAPCPPVAVNRRAEDPLANLRHHLGQTPLRTVLCVDSAGRRETIAELLSDYRLPPDATYDTWQDTLAGEARFALVIAPLTGGFLLPPAGLAVLTENDLYPTQSGRPIPTRRRRADRTSNVDAMVRDLAELHIGDPVVHVQHGIGRYRGLVSMDLGEGPIELLHLEYAHEATLYVPVSQLHLIARYSGADPDQAPLHPLGSGQWEKARRKAARQARDTAAELLALYARRAAREGLHFKFPARDYQAFAEGFGFEETPDQASAMTKVVKQGTSTSGATR
ncbi:Transcription-repair-coupling factor OS=Castellaniella defragrans OX=75697 GN=mfd PE=3 SV=1 [Castellaniella defragrans]